MDNTRKAAADLFIVVDVDVAAATLTVSPDPAYTYEDQNVTWVSTEPDITLEIFWKGPGPEPPCPAPARRCGGKRIGAPAGSRLEYGVRAYRNGTKVAERDPVLEILP